jgi:hypothetical protein
MFTQVCVAVLKASQRPWLTRQDVRDVARLKVRFAQTQTVRGNQPRFVSGFRVLNAISAYFLVDFRHVSRSLLILGTGSSSEHGVPFPFSRDHAFDPLFNAPSTLSQIGDTGLLDFVLKTLSNKVVGGHLVHREYNNDTKVRPSISLGDAKISRGDAKSSLAVRPPPPPRIASLCAIVHVAVRPPMTQVLEYRLEQLAADDPRIAAAASDEAEGSLLCLPPPSPKRHQPKPHTPR